jgi:hypothetical protein
VGDYKCIRKQEQNYPIENTSPSGHRNVEHNLSFEEVLCEYAKQKISKCIFVIWFMETLNVTPVSYLKSSSLMFVHRGATYSE